VCIQYVVRIDAVAVKYNALRVGGIDETHCIAQGALCHVLHESAQLVFI
jgi:hypothetical protein